ncbi:unnamed protein product [Parascedosporium putredinis]|uniref:lytic cellulose monooxygenase (C4-dehydrogenating) n=1 Tax=Parascedosporium putredinis TaxID=1442378 RepID=A0A9P1H890_9PEZI|nr:unnamed protein product [Parascedosporium putredinis]CAI8000562.1 unnamed protein product [Parascedosporium putredinis]
MRSIAFLLAASAVAINNVAGHYIFQQFSSGGTQYDAWKYIRRNSNPDWLQNSPVTDLASPDLRCNVGGGVANGTETLTIKAGSEFTFTLDTAVYHQGPISLYMSKAPGAVEEYDGSGAWFKIFDWGKNFSPSGGSWPMRISYTQNIPTCIPDGEYLLRIQSLGIHNPGSPPQATDPGYTANIYSGDMNGYVVPGPSVFSC